ncbi:MAG: NUDIX domain-containing protein [Erysipelotrichaceae bacterium]
MEVTTFGEKLAGIAYRKRKGAYLIIENSEGHIALVQTPTGYFLPGGGIESNEDHQTCLLRECLEEIGACIQVERFVCEAQEFRFSETYIDYIQVIGAFYTGSIMGALQQPSEPDHQLVWVSREQADTLLLLQVQRYALKQSNKNITQE